MKKAVLAGVIILLVIAGGMVLAGSRSQKADVKYQREWGISDRDLTVDQVGINANMDISIIHTEEEQSSIQFSGMVTKQVAEHLDAAEAKAGELYLGLPEQTGIQLAVSGDDSEEDCMLVICLGKNSRLKRFTLDNQFGHIRMSIPEDLTARIRCKTQTGSIDTVDSQEEADTQLTINSGTGDIEIKRAN